MFRALADELLAADKRHEVLTWPSIEGLQMLQASIRRARQPHTSHQKGGEGNPKVSQRQYGMLRKRTALLPHWGEGRRKGNNDQPLHRH